jgi:hypothetical protein
VIIIELDQKTLDELTHDFCVMIAKILIIEEEGGDLNEKEIKTSIHKRND